MPPYRAKPGKRQRICLVEPFFSGSHERWALGLSRHAEPRFDILSLPGRHWKWRMHGAAATLARRFLEKDATYDAILASDMLNLPLFLSLVRGKSPSIPAAVYFHENQLSYPWSPRDDDKRKGRDLGYAFINYASALAADHVYFNSDFHRLDFIGRLPEFLNRYPDCQNLNTVAEIEAKSSTLWLGMDLEAFDRAKPRLSDNADRPPLLLWNHRWEYDKNPMGFFRVLYALVDLGVDFQLALAGGRFKEEPPYFEEARERLGTRIVHDGELSDFSDYASLLWRADIAFVTSNQDFFGGSVVESAYCGCHPVLPRRLAYPDHFKATTNGAIFYDTESEAVEALRELIASGQWKTPFESGRKLARYDWSNQIGAYNEALATLTAEIGGTKT